MDLHHLNVKLYLENSGQGDLAEVVPIFHRWIQEQNCEELLIDVADYRHVFAGPGVVLIGHQADYSIDNCDGRLGIRYNLQAILEGTNEYRLRQAVRAALVACRRLETEQVLAESFRFNGKDIDLSVNDRLLAANTEETFNVVKPELSRFFEKLFAGSAHSMRRNPDPRRLFSVEVSSVRPFGSEQLLANISAQNLFS